MRVLSHFENLGEEGGEEAEGKEGQEGLLARVFCVCLPGARFSLVGQVWSWDGDCSMDRGEKIEIGQEAEGQEEEAEKEEEGQEEEEASVLPEVTCTWSLV